MLRLLLTTGKPIERVGPRGGGIIVINLNFDWLFFILTAAFFAFAVVRTLGLLFR